MIQHGWWKKSGEKNQLRLAVYPCLSHSLQGFVWIHPRWLALGFVPSTVCHPLLSCIEMEKINLQEPVCYFQVLFSLSSPNIYFLDHLFFHVFPTSFDQQDQLSSSKPRRCRNVWIAKCASSIRCRSLRSSMATWWSQRSSKHLPPN